MYKNVASQKIAIFAWDGASGAPKTGDSANITAQISKDGGATAATDNTNPTELDATDAPGIYIFSMTQDETNGDLIILSATSSTGDVVIHPKIIYTQTVMRGTDGANTTVPDAAGTAATLIAGLNDITVANILNGIIEGTYTLQDALKIVLSYMAGKVSGGGTSSIAYRDVDDTVDRVTITADSDGNRSAVTLDLS